MGHRPGVTHHHLVTTVDWSSTADTSLLLLGLGDADASLAQLIEDLTVVFRFPASPPHPSVAADHEAGSGR